jgi:DNA-binding transcriptional regulator YhcF (GntR family)
MDKHLKPNTLNYHFRPDEDDPLPKVHQIVRSIKVAAENGALQKNERLFSINEFNKRFKVARDTVEKAYNILKSEGYISSVSGKGYYVNGDPDRRLKILLVFNKLSSYKKIIYESFLQTLGDKAKVDLHIHHYNPLLLKESLDAAFGKYNYYVVMPHFFTDKKPLTYLPILQRIPSEQLVLLDKKLDNLPNVKMSVFQDFQNDIHEGLNSITELVKKYKRLILIFPPDVNHPAEIKLGVKLFCKENSIPFSVIATPANKVIQSGDLFIILNELDLAYVIKNLRGTSLKAGRDVGIISFNETVLKELLDITVISTDFHAMGRTAANLILNKETAIVRNPFQLIIRNSL